MSKRLVYDGDETGSVRRIEDAEELAAPDVLAAPPVRLIAAAREAGVADALEAALDAVPRVDLWSFLSASEVDRDDPRTVAVFDAAGIGEELRRELWNATARPA